MKWDDWSMQNITTDDGLTMTDLGMESAATSPREGFEAEKGWVFERVEFFGEGIYNCCAKVKTADSQEGLKTAIPFKIGNDIVFPVKEQKKFIRVKFKLLPWAGVSPKITGINLRKTLDDRRRK